MKTNMSDNNSTKISSLNESNYLTWSEDMQTTLRGKGLRRLVLEQVKFHRSDPNNQQEWDDKMDKACGVHMLRVEQLQ